MAYLTDVSVEELYKFDNYSTDIQNLHKGWVTPIIPVLGRQSQNQAA